MSDEIKNKDINNNANNELYEKKNTIFYLSSDPNTIYKNIDFFNKDYTDSITNSSTVSPKIESYNVDYIRKKLKEYQNKEINKTVEEVKDETKSIKYDENEYLYKEYTVNYEELNNIVKKLVDGKFEDIKMAIEHRYDNLEADVAHYKENINLEIGNMKTTINFVEGLHQTSMTKLGIVIAIAVFLFGITLTPLFNRLYDAVLELPVLKAKIENYQQIEEKTNNNTQEIDKINEELKNINSKS